MALQLVLVEFGCSEAGEAPFRAQVARTIAEVRAVEGCLETLLYARPQRLYLFTSVWRDRAAVERWVRHDFHRQVLMPAFRQWCTEGWFSYWALEADRNRARKCPQCGRWTQALPGWTELNPAVCARCGADLGARYDFDGAPVRRRIDAALLAEFAEREPGEA